MEKKNDNYILLIIIIVILLAIVGIFYFTEKEETIIEEKKINYILLNDYSRFFTVNSCVYKYITFITNKSSDDLLNVLNKDYVSKNNINIDNIYNYVGNLTGNYNFKSKKIYYQIISKDYIKYYVYGALIKDSLDGNGDKLDYYVIIDLDLKNQLFSVTPYDGKIFKEGI